MLHEYFSSGTQGTVTGANIGIEVETDFIDRDTRKPISIEVNRAIFAHASNSPDKCVLERELGRQKLELAIGPFSNIRDLLEATRTCLTWLYEIALSYNAVPYFGPEISSREKLLLVEDPRDELWRQNDGQTALEELCRCSCIQFTVDVNPDDAIRVINSLWDAKIHEIDYTENLKRWKQYIAESKFGYEEDRFAGPSHFESLTDYADKLSTHPVVMHEGQIVRTAIQDVKNPDIELFLRSVWWFYRLRKYGNSLTVEIRPFARRHDETIEQLWSHVAPIFNIK